MKLGLVRWTCLGVWAAALLWSVDSRAAEAEGAAGQAAALEGDGDRGVGFEVNVLWPIFPGGISEFRLLVPVLRPNRRDFRGELVLGTYADFASRVIRDEQDGKVRNLSAKVGFRQFFVYGTHVEVSANLGWRNETARPDGESYDAFHTRIWFLAGYQHEFSRMFYANARGGLGVHLYRSDRFAAEERQLAPGADLNLGVRF
ncbi:MAG: hypothetical protein ACOY0T_05305 [Myxococcota bacterium]